MFEPTRSDVLALIEAAVAAPSADNEHHDLFTVRDGGIDVRIDKFFAACPAGHRRVLTLLSYGAVVENLRLQLVDQGWTFEPAWFPEGPDSDLLVRVDWSALRSTTTRDPLVDHIASRHTNRGLFRGPCLSPDERAAIEAVSAEIDGIDVGWFDIQPRRDALLRLMRMAETARFRTRRHHRELFESIAFADGWKAASTRLIAAGSLGIEVPLRSAFKALRHWPLMRALAGVGVHHLIGFRAGDLPARFAPHLLVLSSSRRSDAAALAAGAAFERIWLTAQSLGLALQPMVASAVLVDDVDETPQAPASQLAKQLREGWRDLLGDDSPFVVFRMGRAAPPGVRSRRMPAVAYLASGN